MPKAITANRLTDGRVVYLGPRGTWSEWLDDAALVESEAALARLMAEAERAVAARKVVAPYAIEVVRDEGGVRALGCRETIRAQGPSTGLGAGRPAHGEAGP